ncbi:MAG: hypothetical protein K9M15_02995 [Candidatus Marinimicrobia bacterium]|nr:hypothetical protein [Candidatus Neomarinimicrobiota bacterium]
MDQNNNTKKAKNNAPNSSTQIDPNKKLSKIKNIRTFRSDASDFVNQKGVSLAELFLKQKKKPSVTEEDLESLTEESKNKTKTKQKFLIFFVFLLLLAGGTYYFFFFKKNTAPTQQFIPPPPATIINSQANVSIEFTEKEMFKKQLIKAINTTHNPGDLVSISITTKDQNGNIKYATSKEFLNLIGVVPPTFVTSFIKDSFFLGSLNLSENHPVLIFEIAKQSNTVFSGFLRWEENILSDLDFIVGELPVSYSSLSFEDQIIKNQNARLVKNGETTVFIYTFLDKKYIIITDNQKSLEEIIRRFVIFKFS